MFITLKLANIAKHFFHECKDINNGSTMNVLLSPFQPYRRPTHASNIQNVGEKQKKSRWTDEQSTIIERGRERKRNRTNVQCMPCGQFDNVIFNKQNCRSFRICAQRHSVIVISRSFVCSVGASICWRFYTVNGWVLLLFSLLSSECLLDEFFFFFSRSLSYSNRKLSIGWVLLLTIEMWLFTICNLSQTQSGESVMDEGEKKTTWDAQT